MTDQVIQTFNGLRGPPPSLNPGRLRLIDKSDEMNDGRTVAEARFIARLWLRLLDGPHRYHDEAGLNNVDTIVTTELRCVCRYGGMSERIEGPNSPAFSVSALQRLDEKSRCRVSRFWVVGPVRVTGHNVSIGHHKTLIHSRGVRDTNNPQSYHSTLRVWCIIPSKLPDHRR